MNFKGHYNIRRFKYLHKDLTNSGFVDYEGPEKIKKTGCFYGDQLNFYIDTSDGINEDLQIYEYCGRILKVIEDSAGKPFLFFKSAHSPKWSSNIAKLAEENGGKVLPFFKWSFNDNFYSYLLPNKNFLLSQKSEGKQVHDVGMFAGLDPYAYPNPSKYNNLIGWGDHETFGWSTPAWAGFPIDTGTQPIHTRKELFDTINNSRFDLLHASLSYKEYINYSLKCKTILNPPGIGEYTSRMMDQCCLGNCIILRKTSYDQGNSWKDYLPEVDFKKDGWEDEFQKIIDAREEWCEKARDYYENYWSSCAIIEYLTAELLKRV